MKVTNLFVVLLVWLLWTVVLFTGSLVGAPSPTPKKAAVAAGTMAVAAQATISLEWNANATSEAVGSYLVYEKVGTTYTLVATITHPTTTFALTNLAAGPHTYVVAAKNVRGEGGKSNEVTVPAAPGIPGNPRINVQFTVP